MFVAVMLSIRTKGILVSEWAFLLFLPLLIYELLYNGPAFVRLGEPFSWLTHLNGGHRWTLLFRRTSPGWCGELAGKRLFPVCGSHQHIKCHILVKTGVFCFCGKENVWKRRRKCAVCELLLLNFRGKGVTKISRTLVREGICRRSESLFLWFMGVFWWWVSNKKNGATTFHLGNGHVSYFCVELLSIFLKPYPRKYRDFVCFCFLNCI